MSETLQMHKLNYELAYTSLFKAICTFTCPETRVIDMTAAADKLNSVRNELIDRGSSPQHFRVILAQAIHDVSDMRLNLHLLEPEDFNG
jgi:hypothetical protein